MALAPVTGDLKTIVGDDMSAQHAVIIFTLNDPNVVVGTGGIRPDAPHEVTPSSNGTFSVNLEVTTTMLADAWYDVRIEFVQRAVGNDTPAGSREAHLMFRIRVPSSGGSLDQLIDVTDGGGPGGIPGPNNRIVWVSQWPPPNPRPFMLWLEQEPGPDPDPFDPRNTSKLHEWRP